LFKKKTKNESSANEKFQRFFNLCDLVIGIDIREEAPISGFCFVLFFFDKLCGRIMKH